MRRASPRTAVVPVAFCVLAACASHSGDTTNDAGEAASPDDGSTVGCTAVGGTCVPYTQACPLPEQSTGLCGNTILICCLPDGAAPSSPPFVPDAMATPPDATIQTLPDAAQLDAGAGSEAQDDAEPAVDGGDG